MIRATRWLGLLGIRVLLLCAAILCWELWGARATAAPSPPSPKQSPASKLKAQAQTPEQKAAQTQLARGRELLRQGDAAGALSAFVAARALEDSLDVELAIADGTAQLGKPVQSHAALSAFIAERRASLTAEERARAEAKLLELQAASAQLALEVSELGAEIQLDGVVVGQSPLPAPLPANPGAHRIGLTKPGFLPQTREVTLSRGQNALRVALVAEVPTGSLRVTSSTPGVIELVIEHRVVGLLPWEGTLPVGPVTLSARTSDQTSPPLEVVVEKDVVKPVTLELSPNLGFLEVQSLATGVRIALDGRLVGVNRWRGGVPPGLHHLEFRRDGFESQAEDVRVTTGGTSSVVVGKWVPVVVPEERTSSNAQAERGLYVRLDLAGAFSSRTDGITRHCAERETSAPTQCSSKGPFGGGLGLRVGYRFKWIAPELFGLGTLSVSYVRASFEQVTLAGEDPFYGPPRREDYVFFRYGFAAGAGVRVSTPSTGIAATGGLGFAVFSQSAAYARTTTGSSTVSTPLGDRSVPIPPQSHSSNTVHQYAPGLVFDAGVLLGASPGTKLYLGFLASVEFAAKRARTRAVNGGSFGTDPQGAPYDYGTPPLNVASGTQFTFGPVLGFQFGY